jgi:hypothetical protein
MAFNINEVVAEMLAAIKSSVKEDWSIVKEPISGFLQDKKDRLELLTSLRIKKQISVEFFNLRLKDEKKILESELHAIAILTKVAAQNAANAAIDVLQSAVNAAVKKVL